ncbi:hypothetical protein MBLNU230_g0831t1 [Neophaeotheca triangularis]
MRVQAFVAAQFPDATFRRVRDNYVSSSGIGHVYFKQTLFGYDIDNADVNVNVRPNGDIFSWGGSAYEGELPSSPPSSGDLTEPSSALNSVVSTLNLPIDPEAGQLNVEEETSFSIAGASGPQPNGQLVYYQNAQGELVPAWRVETDLTDSYLTTYISARESDSEEILAVTDYVADANYQVFKWPLNDPRGNQRTNEFFNVDVRSSTIGWHKDDDQTFYETRGNNAIAQGNPDGTAEYESNPRPQSRILNFREPFDTAWEPEQYINASIVQLFYTSNKFRDVLYVLGFTEEAGNFQAYNFGRGGAENDDVILNTQDGSGINNANFRTPPDGERGRMRMYRTNLATPFRDTSFDAGVVIHEYTHGLSNRLTGGPLNARCLSTLESGGMGEGWSDFYPTAIRVSNDDDRTVDYPIGDYSFNDPLGIRAVIYSTSMETNPYTYSTLNGLGRVHEFGTVWCSMLYEVLWNLIDARGNTALTIPLRGLRGAPLDGRYLSMKLVLDGMALQPCSPTFVQARDAIIDADEALTNGRNRCLIWRGFAKRGLGVDAANINGTYTDDFTLPSGC